MSRQIDYLPRRNEEDDMTATYIQSFSCGGISSSALAFSIWQHRPLGKALGTLQRPSRPPPTSTN